MLGSHNWSSAVGRSGKLHGGVGLQLPMESGVTLDEEWKKEKEV